jgi:AraC family transcriptional regulator, regulatory protein of adaptative response / DNA-3-methyladenine glycosylase II
MPAVFAVVTTGIYCRPTCAAQPRPGNVRSFPLAAAAEAAGYRACLRCRPYCAPQSVPWTGPELVCRAVRLILDGALDAATEAQLGHRLGVSARHLRRLFMAHLGVTPDGLARSARTHFARRLLDDTDLTITEIAFAAGFGSLRQFNRACQEMFRAPPHVLRAKRRKADRLVADGTYRRTVTIAGDPGVLELYPGAEDHLLLRAHLPHWEELVHLVNRARRIANLDLDLEEPTRRLGADPVIGPLLRARPGVRPPGTFDPFETGVRAIIGQRATIAAASAITGRLVERLGAPVPGLQHLGLTRTFPQPDTLAGADLGGLGLSGARQAAVRAFAQAVAEGALPLDRSASLDRLVVAISELDGLGPWTAHYLALRLGEPDAWPIRDRGLTALAARWRPWRALAAAHLWMANGWQKEQPRHG